MKAHFFFIFQIEAHRQIYFSHYLYVRVRKWNFLPIPTCLKRLKISNFENIKKKIITFQNNHSYSRAT